MHTLPNTLSVEDLGLSNIAQGSDHLRIILDQMETHEELCHLLGQYVAFNASFGAGVAHLSGNIANHPDLFHDTSDHLSVLSDQSGEVAKHIFAAAIDEFGGMDARFLSHRRLAQSFLKGTGKYFNQSPELFNTLIAPTQETKDAITSMQSGYGFGKEMGEKEVFEGIGFHIGSEYLAGDEFRTIDHHLREYHASMVASLERVDPAIAEIAPYIWIKIHTTVEEDHAAHALEAANLALRYYSSNATSEHAKEQILNGVRMFGDVQSRFFNHIAD